MVGHLWGMTHLNKSLLVLLLDLAQSDVGASVQVLAERLGVSRREVAVGLNELAELDLVRAEKVRLTFLGLAAALGLRGRMAQTLAA